MIHAVRAVKVDSPLALVGHAAAALVLERHDGLLQPRLGVVEHPLQQDHPRALVARDRRRLRGVRVLDSEHH
eukprot:6711776-Prymnesium_polylepis.1